MGCDGGVVARRDDLVKDKKKETKKYNTEDRYRYCSLTHKLFKKRVVCDVVGRLYNKDGLLKALINHEMPEKLRYIHNKKDFIELNIEWSNGMIVCPLKKVEFSPGHQFVALKCGCVISKLALDEIKSINGHKCPLCETEGLEFILLNPPLEEMEKQMELHCKLFDQKQNKTKSIQKEENKIALVTQPIANTIADQAKVNVNNQDDDEIYRSIFTSSQN
ncbi:hypothetical protein, conserved [Entamoeba dispar SAW760]|uniref:Uncharacterized protein n=1 Tax=Entamoeba dispar (strain ATCC PRA-260 / SAW760) TaxID=370354 RepID=B0EQ64_ENTDS|nr:uncharacterized protein EDI_151320 [Entamoeba dispar SAW760]EDR23352.1 hypothetical protein, conserved [Entamoeba dispar SAW760]|eukprot:EDR23352.1 hypothetical protein, conserved [Entamoeba dispar SAW760]